VHQLFGGNDLETKRAVWLRDWRRVHHRLAYVLRNTGRGEAAWRKVQRLAGLAAGGRAAGRDLFRIRCDRGAMIALDLGLTEATASAIRSMDEHWDGGGHPDGLRGDRIPLLARIIGLSQVVEIFGQERGHAAAFDVARRRRGRWFDPELVGALLATGQDKPFWRTLWSGDEAQLLARAEPSHAYVEVTEARLDRIASAFASVIDAKSPYTSDHSRRVAGHAARIAGRLNAPAHEVVRIHRAGLLHDIGKLGVPNSVLDKPGRLTAAEWALVRRHPRYSFEILDRVPLFREFAFDASCHHETLDGSGYHLGLDGSRLTVAARVLAIADRADALLADRPYRRGLSVDDVRTILSRECQGGLICPVATRAAVEVLDHAAHSPTEPDTSLAPGVIAPGVRSCL
jgi:HD-GYP domain-containing protein (c-di-GMP phosphodiesterase class II)